MLFKKSPEKFWNLIANKYAADPITDLAAYESKIEKLKTYLKPEDEVLDIGCGTGTQCMDLAGKVRQVTGIDISGKLLAFAEQRKAERNLENVEFVKIPLADAHFAAERFDVVMAFYVLHFQADVEVALKRIHSWLKPGGLLITETVCLGERSKILGKVLRLAGHLGLMPMINVLSYRQLEQALADAGFTLREKIRFSDKEHGEYTLIVRKQGAS